MINSRPYFLVAFLLLSMCLQAKAQFIDFNRPQPYQAIFKATDRFGAGYLDSLASAWPQATPDTLQYAMLNDLAYYWHTRNLQKSMHLAMQGYQMCKETESPLWQGRFQITMGAVLLRMEHLDSARSVLENAKTKVSKSDLPFLNTQLGYVFERKGQLDKAADFAMASLRLGESLHDQKAIALAYSDLSNLFWKQSKFKKGLEYGLKSMKIFEQRNIKDLDYDFTLYVVANNYLALGQKTKALDYFNRSIAIGERYGFYNNLSDAYISLVDLHAALGNMTEATRAGEQAVRYAELLGNNFMIMRSWLSIGQMQIKASKFHEAIGSLQQCLEAATPHFGDEYYLNQAYKALGEAYAATQNYKKAYDAFLHYDQLKDSVFTAEADQRISRLQTEFDVAIKENTIKLQEQKLAQQKTRQLAAVIAVVVMALFIIFLWRTYRINKRKNALLEKQNREKEFLLKEIHHRVKNNLEVVSSLLALQSAQLTDAGAVSVMQESQNRVQSMSMIHQKLYQGTHLSTIEMKAYFQNLADYITDAFGEEDRIKVLIEMAPIELDVDTAIPLGLIVNELLTNAFKYGFPHQRKGTIRISLSGADAQWQLEVADDGIGIDQSQPARGTGFGSQLVDLLCRQLQGQLQTHGSQGTTVRLTFSKTDLQV